MSTPLLETRELTKRFDGLTAVNQVNLKVYPGNFLGLIGPNGSGKTTALNLLSGVLRPTSGEIWMAGENLTGLPAHQIAQRGIARTFQNLRVFRKMTVLENVLVGRHRHMGYSVGSLLRLQHAAREQAARERAMELLRFADLEARAGDDAGSLAYGEQRRLELARALATEPRLLLLDEPLAGMNPAEGERMLELFQAIQTRGITVILVEHTMRVVMRICNPITVLNFGRQIANGSPDVIRNDPEVVRAYLGSGGRVRRAPRTGT